VTTTVDQLRLNSPIAQTAASTAAVISQATRTSSSKFR
jgi:hypothetical protein